MMCNSYADAGLYDCDLQLNPVRMSMRMYMLVAMHVSMFYRSSGCAMC